MRDLLIGEVFRAAARAVPDTVAAVAGDRRLTYGQLAERGDAVAAALAAQGVTCRDRVVMWSGTDLDAVPLFAGLAFLGAVFAPANALLSADEATDMIALARPSLLVVDEAHAADGAAIAARLGIESVLLGDLAGAPAAPAPVDHPDRREDDTHVVFFTSGSTGKPKGVMLSNRTNYLRTHPGSQFEPRGATVCLYPLFHMGAWTIALQAFQTQTTLVIVPASDPVGVLHAVRNWEATHLNAIPAVWRRLLDAVAEVDGEPLASIRLADSGTSATPPELLEALAAAMPDAERRVFYGSTEAGAVTLLRDREMAAKPGSCGVPQHSLRTRTDPVTGELQVAGPLLFDGYFDNDEATAEAFTDDGWFRTGDVAETDAEGFLSIVGRARDLIRTGGESVAPGEVEAVLAAHPSFADVAVVGLPDPQWGETVCAAVVLRGGAAVPDLDEVRAFCDGKLARFKQPRRVAVIDAVPRTPATNQVQRRLIIERLTGG